MSELPSFIREEIARDGPISFARFMELALYHPQYGYYEKSFSQTGKQGDFFTNVSVGPLFGQFLGFDFAKRGSALDCPRFYLVEGGAHDGRLAADILDYLKQFQPEFFERVIYLIVEPSARRAYHQHELLEAHGKKMQWIKHFSEISTPLTGICFSNELLDAMPVHVFRWDAASLRWKESGVSSRGEDFIWAPLPRANPDAESLLPEISPELAKVFPHGFTIEISPAAVKWWGEAGSAFKAGWLAAFDYGSRMETLLQPERARGTLRSYTRHHMSVDVLQDPGEKDITASVNFSHILAAGEESGWTTDSFGPQGNYLKQVLEQIDLHPEEFPLWTASRFRQLTSLVHPEHLGRSFKTLIQSKTVSDL